MGVSLTDNARVNLFAVDQHRAHVWHAARAANHALRVEDERHVEGFPTVGAFVSSVASSHVVHLVSVSWKRRGNPVRLRGLGRDANLNATLRNGSPLSTPATVACNNRREPPA